MSEKLSDADVFLGLLVLGIGIPFAIIAIAAWLIIDEHLSTRSKKKKEASAKIFEDRTLRIKELA